MVEHYDVAIIGSGPGGYVAAIRAAQLGFKTACIEKHSSLGGTCLNVGCIPSKTLLHTTELLLHLQQKGQNEGLNWVQLNVEFSQLMKHKKEVIKGLVNGISSLFQSNSITTLIGEARFVNPHLLTIQNGDETTDIEASYVVIATGSSPISLPDLPFDEKQIVSSTGALSLSKIPDRLVVIGGGVIGVELASVYQRLGAQVTIVEMLDRICPALEPTMSKQLMQLLKKQGMTFMLGGRLASAVQQPNEVILTIVLNDIIQNLSANVVLVAVGRRPYTEGLQLEKAGIQIDQQGFIPIDLNFRTAQPHIFAIGDVIEGTMLAHRASAEGLAVIESLKGKSSVVNYLSIPNVIYTYPEVGTVGLTEDEAKKVGLDIFVGSSYFRGNSRARCTSETEGFVKIIGEKKTGRLLGMHILGPHASELIGEGMLAIQQAMKVKDIAEGAQAHPTLSEAIKEAALDALGMAIH